MCGLQVCYYRDKNSINKFQIAKVTTEGIDICKPFALETNWDLKVRGGPVEAYISTQTCQNQIETGVHLQAAQVLVIGVVSHCALKPAI